MSDQVLVPLHRSWIKCLYSGEVPPVRHKDADRKILVTVNGHTFEDYIHPMQLHYSLVDLDGELLQARIVQRPALAIVEVSSRGLESIPDKFDYLAREAFHTLVQPLRDRVRNNLPPYVGADPMSVSHADFMWDQSKEDLFVYKFWLQEPATVTLKKRGSVND